MTQPPAGAAMGARGGGPPAEPPQWASEPINVGENGIAGLVVHLNPAVTVAGRIQFIGGAPQPQAQIFNRITVQMSPSPADSLTSGAGQPIGRFSPDQTFLVPGVVPGKYTLNVQAAPGFPTMKSVMSGGADLTDLPLVVADKDLSEIVITFVDTPLASLTINIASAPGTQGDDGSILVFPVDRKYWAETVAARRRFRQVAMTTKSTATTPELPGGDYYVLAATALEVADWMEAGKLELLARRAQRVTIPDTGKATVEVRR
jgi:hypothetical protein